MRRLLAYIVLAVTMLAVVVFNVQAGVEEANWSQEFDKGTEVAYHVSDADGNYLDSNEMSKLIKTLGERLDAAGATNYILEDAVDSTSNRSEVKIVLGSRFSENIDNILRSAMAYGEFAITTTDGTEAVFGDEGVIRGEAEFDFLQEDNSQAYVKVKVDEEKIKAVIDHANETDKLLVLWQDKPEDLDYEDLTDEDYTLTINEGTENEITYTNTQLQNKVLAVISLDSPSADAENPNSAGSNNSDYIKSDNTTLKEKYGINEDDESAYLTFDSYGYVNKSESTHKMNADSVQSFVRILNNEELDVTINEIYRRNVSASYQTNTVEAKTLMIIACLVALVGSVCFLIIKYRSLAITGSIGIGLVLLVTIAALNLLSIQVGPTMIIALIASLALSVNMLCVYYERTKDDALNGRALSKASNEGFRKTISTAIDSTVLFVVLGIVLGVISSEGIRSFAIIFGIAGFLNILFTFLLSKVMNNFLCTSKASDNPKAFNYKAKQIANLDGVREEEIPESKIQKFDIEKAKKPALITAIVAFAVSVISVVAFSLIPTTDTFNFSSQNAYGRIEIRSVNNDIFDYESVMNDSTLTDEQKEKFASSNTQLQNFVVYLEEIGGLEVVNSWAVTNQVIPHDEENYYIYLYADLEEALNLDSTASENDVKLYEQLNTFVEVNNDESDQEYIMFNTYEVNPGIVVGDFYKTMILMAVTLGIGLVYFLIRYRYTFALSNGISLFGGTAITLGLLSLTRIQVSAYVGIGVVGGMLVSLLLALSFGNRMNQLKNESKVKVTSYEQRKEITLATYKSNSNLFVATFALIVGTLIVMIPLSPLAMAPIYVGAILSTVINGLLFFFLAIPLHLEFESKIKYNKVRERKAERNVAKREKLAKQSRNRGAEPEEIIIPGIND